MSYALIFDKSGDQIAFDPVNIDVLDFYIDQLNQQGLNKFSSCDQQLGQLMLSRLEAFRSCILEVNSWLYDLAGIEFEVFELEEYLDQKLLNKMHADWVNSQSMIYNIQQKRKQSNHSDIAEQIHDMFPDDIQTPTLATVVEKIGKLESYGRINEPYIHKIESSFNNIQYQVNQLWTKIADNPFSKQILTNDQANLSISFNHLGRTLYNKFLNFDNNLEYRDENSFDELLGFVTLSLQQSQTVAFSPEYVNWCNLHNREPIGNVLNIGNIPNLFDNLTRYRKIIFKNLLNQNSFSIHNTQG